MDLANQTDSASIQLLKPEAPKMLKFSDVRIGDKLLADGGFTCIQSGLVDIHGEDAGLYFCCQDGKHFLDGQEDEDGFLVGLSRAPTPPPEGKD